MQNIYFKNRQTCSKSEHAHYFGKLHVDFLKWVVILLLEVVCLFATDWHFWTWAALVSLNGWGYEYQVELPTELQLPTLGVERFPIVPQQLWLPRQSPASLNFEVILVVALYYFDFVEFVGCIREYLLSSL